MKKEMLTLVKKMSIVAAFIVISLFIIAGCIKTAKVNEEFNDAKYVSYEVKPGDTLWSIAEEFNEFDVDTRDYVEKVREVNGIKGDLIRIGSNLILILPQN